MDNITKITADLNALTFQAEREFEAPPSMVWMAYTEPELLDQWWAPSPWKTETIEMDFGVGGQWIYDMVGSNGERHRAMQIFNKIAIEKCFAGMDAFMDADGQVDESMPVAKWKNTFEKTERGTLVTIFSEYPTKEMLEFALKMGMDKGVSMAHDNLSELLSKMTV